MAKILTLLVLLMTAVTGAWAETETITTASDLWQGAKTFTGTNVTVSVKNGGNENGSYVSVTNTMDISVTGDNIITGLVLTIGINSGQAGYMLAQPGNCTVSGSGSHSTFVTVTDINASSVTMKMDDYAVYVEKVEVTYANPYTPTPVAGQTNQWKFLMPVFDVELQVEYYPGMLTLGGDAIEGGTVEVVGLTDDALPAGFEKDAEGNIYVAEGTTFTVKATPEEGYHFVCWSDDETNTNPEREITMPEGGSDLTLSATFAENEYDITFSEGTNPDPENPEWTATPNPAKTKQTVTVTYSGSKKVIGVKAEKKAAVPTLDLATVTEDTTVEDGYTVTGTLGANVKISIADGATVTLLGVTINRVNNSNYKWAGINCLGDATIILSGTNTVKGFYDEYPGIHVPQDKTLTIDGSGSLTASSKGYACGIGGGDNIACGNIVIAGGTITATGGHNSAGIGGGNSGSCGNISITGGTITANGGGGGAGIGNGNGGSCGNISITGGTINATGGEEAAGIGGGYGGSCGNITITNGVTSVTATKGNSASHSIGVGSGTGTCGTVTVGCTLDGGGNPVGGTTGQISTSPYTYQPSN